ncbi:MAG: hypothetical protein ACRDTZ_04595 [Pseudonocardiaceae bacterium]
MHRVGGEAWGVHIAAGSDLTLALYVREALDLPTRVIVPEPLLPPVTAVKLRLSADERRSAAEDWTAWWRVLVAGRWQVLRGVPLPPGRPLDPTGADQLLLDPFRVQASSPLTAGVSAVRGAARDYLRERAEQDPRPAIGDGLDFRALVRSLARGLGRRPRDFRLQLDIVPLDGSRTWTLGIDPDGAHAWLLVTADFATHPERHRPVITDTLTRIF